LLGIGCVPPGVGLGLGVLGVGGRFDFLLLNPSIATRLRTLDLTRSGSLGDGQLVGAFSLNLLLLVDTCIAIALLGDPREHAVSARGRLRVVVRTIRGNRGTLVRARQVERRGRLAEVGLLLGLGPGVDGFLLLVAVTDKLTLASTRRRLGTGALSEHLLQGTG